MEATWKRPTDASGVLSTIAVHWEWAPSGTTGTTGGTSSSEWPSTSDDNNKICMYCSGEEGPGVCMVTMACHIAYSCCWQLPQRNHLSPLAQLVSVACCLARQSWTASRTVHHASFAHAYFLLRLPTDMPE